MKNSTFITVLLTLTMLLMVAIAAFVFLFPRQQAILQQNETLTTDSEQLRQDLAGTGLNLASSESTREAITVALATSEANGVVLAGELVESDQKTTDLQTAHDELADQLAGATSTLAELEIENQQLKSQFPVTVIVSPEDGAIVKPGEPVDVVIMAFDPQGITAVNLTLGDNTQDFNGNDDPLFIYRQEWQPGGQGTYSISLMAVNIGGKASIPTERIIEVVDIDALNAEVRSEIEANVIELTGLTPQEAIEPTFLTRDELGTRLEADFEENSSPEEMRQDALVLSAFDFVEPTFDLYQAFVELYGGGILGFYDPETAEFVVVSEDDALDVEEQFTHAHEFVHALQDQYYDLELLADDEMDSEASFALRALAEGHATLIQSLYLASGYFSDAEISELFASYNAVDTGYLETAPDILITSLEFPYEVGLEFVSALYRLNGLDAINAAWENLPQSTEQILHPEKYLSEDAPQIVTLPPLTDTLGIGWHLLDEDTFGEFYLRQYLSQQLDDRDVDVAATGWGGDRYAVYENEADGTLVMALYLTWDSSVDLGEFMALYQQYPAGLFGVDEPIISENEFCWSGADDVICLYQIGSDALIVRGPDVATAVIIQQAVANQ